MKILIYESKNNWKMLFGNKIFFTVNNRSVSLWVLSRSFDVLPHLTLIDLYNELRMRLFIVHL